MHFFGSCLTQHVHNAVTGCSTDDRIIDHDHSFAFYCFTQYIQFHTDAGLTAALFRFDKGTADIAVFHKSSTVWNAGLKGISKCCCISGFRDTDYDICIHR